MPIFRSPGLADEDASVAVIDAWNERIVNEVERRAPSPFLVLDPAAIPDGTPSTGVKWPGQPLEPEDCLGEEWAEKLSDWGWAGRAELHNEYLEYALIMAVDANGNRRPKRFVATTELMEWWRTMAVHDADFFLNKVEEITGNRLELNELFGVDVPTWKSLPESTRWRLFAVNLVGSGRSQPPLHPLNQKLLLFMGHRINGLDDLIFVVHFGTFPYAVNEGGSRRRARIEEIFKDAGREDLFCRNADPGAANGAYNQAFLIGTDAAPRGRNVALADPLGMYIRTFSTDDLFHNNAPVPASWSTLSRGDANDTPQRLEFGPPDSEDVFLDEITIGQGSGAPTVSGFQLAKRIEVGPVVVVGGERPIADSEFVDVPAAEEGTIECGLSGKGRCAEIEDFKREFDSQLTSLAGTRGGPIG
jgi:hypothetical protein